ncbi:MAG: type II toxin-antitoxin system VapB family antitoxin [Leptospirales bacterium]
MATNLAINDELLNEAKKIGHHKSKKDTVNEALKEYVQRRKQLEITELFGSVDYEASYDHNKYRIRKLK